VARFGFSQGSGLPLLTEPSAPIPHTDNPGPRTERPGDLDGHQITAAIPVAVAKAENATVYFQILSYAGVLTLGTIVDPDHGPDLDDLIQRLSVELELIMAPPE
jgi:hypothetical protein